jgi:hypothetical protein
MSETHIYSPYKDMAYPERHNGGCMKLILWVVFIVVLLLAMYSARHF